MGGSRPRFWAACRLSVFAGTSIDVNYDFCLESGALGTMVFHRPCTGTKPGVANPKAFGHFLFGAFWSPCSPPGLTPWFLALLIRSLNPTRVAQRRQGAHLTGGCPDRPIAEHPPWILLTTMSPPAASPRGLAGFSSFFASLLALLQPRPATRRRTSTTFARRCSSVLLCYMTGCTWARQSGLATTVRKEFLQTKPRASRRKPCCVP